MDAFLNIDAVKENETVTLQKIAKETFLDTFANENDPQNISAYVAKTFTIEQISKELKATNSCFLFARIDTEVVGYLKLNTKLAQTEHDLPNAMEVERIYARRSHQGKGIGKALMQKSIMLAQKANVDWLWLGVWEKNLHAIKFYERQGFEAFGQHDFYMGVELQRDIMMRLPI